MQAVIFAAGRGTRMKEMTDNMPKSMLSIASKPLLERKIEALPGSIDEVVLIVGYLGSTIQKHFGGEFAGKKIFYIEQEQLSGTADALWRAQPVLKDRFLAMNGDDLYATEDLETCMTYEWSMLVEKRDPLLSGGKVFVDEDNRITDVVEGTHRGAGLINAGAYVLDTRVFQYPLVQKAPGSDEYGLPQTILGAVRDLEVAFIAVPTTFWIQITAPEDLKKAEEMLMQRQ